MGAELTLTWKKGQSTDKIWFRLLSLIFGGFGHLELDAAGTAEAGASGAVAAMCSAVVIQTYAIAYKKSGRPSPAPALASLLTDLWAGLGWEEGFVAALAEDGWCDGGLGVGEAGGDAGG